MILFCSALKPGMAYATRRNEENLNSRALAFHKKTKLHLNSPVNASWSIVGLIQGL